MPRSGGEAEKLGNHFEAAWTVNSVLDVFQGESSAITVEPLGEESQGVEFYVVSNEGQRQFHTAKRQKTGGDWSIADLCRPHKLTGRSIVGDLFHKSVSDPTTKTRFVSSTGANELRELSDQASKASDPSEFRRSLSPSLTAKLDKSIRPICANDENLALTFLQNLEVILQSHQHLVRTIERRIDTLFYRHDGRPLDPGDVRREISDYVVGHLGMRIDRDGLRDYLQTIGIGFRDWKTDPTVSQIVRKTNDRYLNIVETELINSAHIEREVVDDILASLSDSHSKGALVVAPAGFGKSCVLAQCVSRLTASQTPIVCLRMDTFMPCTTARQLRAQIDLPASPAVVLAGIADNQHSVLLVDQLDSMSLVSGRHPRLWEAFSELSSEVAAYPHMKMLLACRDFDLEHDQRLRPLAHSSSAFTKHTLGKLSKNEVVDSIIASGRSGFTPTEKQLEILGVPFHLLLFLQGKPDSTFGSVAQLYNAYSKRKRQNLRDRLERPAHWTPVIEALTERMNADQLLFAPKSVVDRWSDDAEAMVSEHVLEDMLDQDQYRFFHESFFDYAYARHFADPNRTVLDFLCTTEQHLFRRSQVRQILDYRREYDSGRYIADINDILHSPHVRFHIKRMVASGFSRADAPTSQEWQLIEPRLFRGPLSRHLWGALCNHPGWFDLLDKNGTLRRWLTSEDDSIVEAAIRYVEPPDLQELQSARVAALIRPYAQSGTAWDQRIIRIMSWHKIHTSTEMRRLNIALIEHGSYDDYSGKPSSGAFWDQYYGVDQECPTFFIDVLRAWFDRSVQRLQDGDTSSLDSFGQNRSDIGTALVLKAGRSQPVYYVDTMLPLVTAAIVKTTVPTVRNRLWPSLSNVGNPHSLGEAILLALRQSLQHLARHHVDLFRQLVTPLLPHPHQVFGYLLLRAWQDNPHEFADDCIQYLLSDLRRLNIGYGSWVADGDGTGHCAVSRGAINATSETCSDSLFSRLETAIVYYCPKYELSYPKHRGYTEFLLLEALDESRLSENAARRIRELERKFPGPVDNIVREDAEFEMKRVGPPIAKERALIMTDNQWISAMRKYDGTSHDRFGGGAEELSHLLRESVKVDRHRFASLPARMSDEIDPVYFSSILDGMSGRFVNADNDRKTDKRAMQAVDTDVCLRVIDRIHALPQKPCGSSLVHCIRALSDRNLPSTILGALSYYAVHDPDPAEDIWRKRTSNGDAYYRGDPYSHGINSVRGQASEAIGSLLFDDRTRLDALRPALESLSQDRIVSVRTSAIDAFLPLLNFVRDLAVRLFVAACSDRPEMWCTPPFERFVHYAVYTHYRELRPILQSALSSRDSDSAEIVARQITLAELDDVDVGSDDERVRRGSVAMRKPAAGVYARNVAKEVVGPVCMSRLQGFFEDDEEKVRLASANAFSHVSDEWLSRSRDFILRFVESSAFETGPYHVLHAIEESNLGVPDVIWRVAERVLEFLGEEGTHVAYHGSMIAGIIAKLVVRQYQQIEEDGIKTRCLDLIDRLEQAGYFGIDTELARLDR